MTRRARRAYRRVDEAVEVVRLGLGDDRRARAARAAARRLRPDRRRPGARRRARRSARAAEAEASTTRSPSGGVAGRSSTRPVERDEVGAELVDEQRARALRRREEHAARRAAAARRAGLPASRRAGRGRATRATSAAAVAGPIAATRAALPCIRRASSRAPFGLVTTTQSYTADVDRLVAERLDLDQRAEDDVVPERLEPRDELLGLPPGG